MGFCPAGLLGGEFPVNVSTKICGMCNRQGCFFTAEHLSQSTTFHDHEFFTIEHVHAKEVFTAEHFHGKEFFTIDHFSR